MTAAAGVKVLPATEPGQRFYEVLHAFDKQEHPDTWAQLAASWKSVYANMERSFTSGVKVRCELCGYQHGHAIGCTNNPVDMALTAGEEVPAHQP